MLAPDKHHREAARARDRSEARVAERTVCRSGRDGGSAGWAVECFGVHRLPDRVLIPWEVKISTRIDNISIQFPARVAETFGRCAVSLALEARGKLKSFCDTSIRQSEETS
jgi:hypothetical protein